MTRVPPADVDAEAAVLGAILVSPRVLDDLVPILTAQDFYAPQHRAVYGALLALRAEGAPVDLIAVAGAVPSAETPILPFLMELQATVGSIGSAVRHAHTILEHALRRQAIVVAADITAAAFAGADIDSLIQLANDRVADLVRPTPDVPPPDLADLRDFLDREKEHIPGGEWAIPGLLRRTWRAVFVAGEGVGKSTIMRQVAILTARGVHPFSFTEIPRVRTLMVDCENPAEVIDHQAGLVLRGLGEIDPGWCWLWSRPQGIDVRSRSSRAELEAAIAHVRPALVCMGPVYKTYRQAAAENYELVAMEVMQVLDELRTRYKFALILEHHMPGSSGGARREGRPKGSAAWLHWSEFGVTLQPTEVRDGKVERIDLKRYRYDRIPAAWPSELVRGVRHPWEGVWPSGTFQDQPANESEPF